MQCGLAHQQRRLALCWHTFFKREIGWSRIMANVYWLAIAGICLLGTVKPI